MKYNPHSIYFPNTAQVARFDPRSQLIFLNEISGDEILEDIRNEDFIALRTTLPTVMHEITHWVDVVGTRWGDRYLNTVYQAYDILHLAHRPGAESEFHRFLRLHDADRRILYSTYYRTHFPSQVRHDHTHTWAIDFSSGYEFDLTGSIDPSLPILFVRFSERTTGRPIVRQPLCVGALLETTAVWSEIATSYGIVEALGRDARLVENALIRKEYLEQLYTEELTLYNAPVHLVATFAVVTDAVIGFQLAALAALASLNLSAEHFSRITPNKDMDPWRDRFGAFAASLNPAYAFFTICCNGPKIDQVNTPLDWVNAALTSSNLPTYEEILSEAADFLSENQTTCVVEPFASSRLYLRSLGAAHLALRSRAGDAACQFRAFADPDLVLPPMFDREGNLFSIGLGNFRADVFDPSFMFDAEANLHTEIRNFLGACR